MANQQQNRSSQQPKKRNACSCTKRSRLRFGGLKSSNKNGSYPIISTSQRNQTSVNKSIITLYRKNRNRWKNKEINKHKRRLSSPIKEPTNSLAHPFGTGDACAGGPCRENLDQLIKLKNNTNDNTEKLLTKIAKHVCKCNEKGQLEKYDINSDVVNDKKSFIGKIFCKCENKDKDHKTAKNIGEKENIIDKKVTKNTKHNYLCKCSKYDDAVISQKHANDIKNTEMGENNAQQNIICKCKIKNKLKPTVKTSRRVVVTKNKKAKGSNVGYGDHTLESTKPKTYSLNKNTGRGVNAGDQTGEPLFEMKVDWQNMQIINADEINKVRTSGKLQPRRSCICPSHQGIICKRGVCEKALKNKQTNFDCKCKIKKIAKECTDLTCDSNGFVNMCMKSTIDRNPLFEVKLDPGNMKIVNKTEIKDIFVKSTHGTCPSGICRSRGNINCKCVKKKLKPAILGCTERTCKTEGRRYLTYMCSKIFSNIGMLTERENSKAKPVIHRRDGLNINFPRDHRITQNNHKHKDIQLKKAQGTRISKNINKVNKTVRREKSDETKRKSNASSINEFIVQCLHRKRMRCKKRMKEEEKALNVAEKKAIKEHRKILHKQNMARDDPRWNCLTKLIAGLLNLIVNTIKKLIIGVWTALTNPIKSLVYIKRRINDPNGTITKLYGWFQRSYGDTTSKVSQKIKNINALNVIADTLEDTAFFNALADKGQTKEEKAIYEKRRMLRRQRIERRERDIHTDCRHILLKTMRKHPWLCCYYICPDLYPQCLNLRSFLKSFCNVIIYLLAFACWTPCIAAFEVGRALLCCLL